MSLRRHLLNLSLRLSEQRFLARVETPAEVRASFESKARWLFRPPRGTHSTRATLGGVSCLCVGTSGPATLLYFHGGAYVFGSARTHLGMVARLSQLTGLPAILPDYRLAPEAPFPAALEDAVRVYQAVSAKGAVILGGDSAGGGLALSLLARVCADNLAQPAMTFALSPFTDMTFSGDSLYRNADSEVVLPVSRLEELRDMYLQGADPANPGASPLFADFSGSGPVLLTTSDAEILEDDTLRMRDRLMAQGVTTDLIHGRGLPHVWPYFRRMIPEADRDLRRIAGAIRGRVAPPGGRIPPRPHAGA